MDAETIKTLADLPIVAVLIYLLVREQAQKEKLLNQLCEQAQQHARDLVEIVLHGVGSVKLPDEGGVVAAERHMN